MTGVSPPPKPSLILAMVKGVAGLVPFAGPIWAEMIRYGEEMDDWRLGQVAEGVYAECDDAERFARHIAEDERLLSMLGQAIEAGRRSPWETKRRLMGRVVGRAVLDDADIDDHAALLAALAAFEAPHARELARLARAVTPLQQREAAIAEPYQSQLIAHGAIRRDTVTGLGGGGVFLQITEFGQRLLDWLREGVADALPSNGPRS